MRLKQNSNALAKLRSEVSPQDAPPISVQSEPVNLSIQAEAQLWLNRVNLLRQHLAQMPELKIPELQFLRETDWLRVAEADTWETEDDYRKNFKELRAQAKVNFGAMIRSALIDFANANNWMLPSTISQLQPYFRTQASEALLDRYELAQTGRFDLQSQSPWVVERAAPVDKKFDTRLEVRPGVVWPVHLPDESR